MFPTFLAIYFEIFEKNTIFNEHPVAGFIRGSSYFLCRSDEQRSVKQKERKERELEHCSFNPERMEDGCGQAMSMVIYIDVFHGNVEFLVVMGIRGGNL